MSHIHVIGAREHNLKNVSVKIPKKKIVVFTGVSGSGKSSLVFDTLYAEAQRQLIETFSSFARRRLPKISRPDVDEIRDITTTITIDQKKLGNNPRSTVGTATELYTYLRLLYSRCGDPVTYDSRYFGFNNPYGMCSKCKGLGRELDVNVDVLLDMEKSLNEGAIMHSHFKKEGWFFRTIKSSGLFDLDKPLKDWDTEEFNLLLHADKLKIKTDQLIQDFNFYGIVPIIERRIVNHDETPSYLSKNGNLFINRPCSDCGGSRINKRARDVNLNGKTIPSLVDLELTELMEFLETVSGPVSDPIVNRMKPILQNLIDIGVGYLSLNRGVGTLSGGESQRVKMARQLGCDLTDLTYIFDEPSVGLHQKDISKLVDMLVKLKEKGNNILVVEHDQSVMENSDYIFDLGPGAGVEGGNIEFEGTYADLMRSDTLTGRMLGRQINYESNRRKPKGRIKVTGASIHNLKNISVEIPTGIFLCVTGVAGSGKSSLILDVFSEENPDCIVIDQSAVGRSSRSNPATYTKVFDYIRRVFSKATGKPVKLFSFNSDGACPKCKGTGSLKVDMFFLDSVSVTCDECEGKRYKPEVLDLYYRGCSINDVLNMTVSEAMDFFEDRRIMSRLKVLNDVGLGYLKLGQPVSTLSGGEAQRIKLARELHKKGNIYILDEPTTGLHMADIEKLLMVINRLVDRGNSVIVIEHNMDVIKNADWIIDMGPEGGSKGGEIIVQGTLETIMDNKQSYTGQYLKRSLHLV
ncbi:ATP-binding cassette domain-containing protein [Candidatus Bathyarchaeota archaeon]|nr:ATP-binding cassette domain-containing protein [Candidatus Bathyarchaeota archaeon]